MEFNHNNREQRKLDKQMLRDIYEDYDPKHHDAFVIRFNSDNAAQALAAYHKNRGIE